MATLEEMLDLQKRFEEAKKAKQESGLMDALQSTASGFVNRPTYASIMLNRPNQRVDMSGLKGAAFDKPEDIADLYKKYEEAKLERENKLQMKDKELEAEKLKTQDERAFQKELMGQKFGQEKYLKSLDLAQKQSEKHPKDVAGKLEKLNATDKVRFDNVALGLDGIKGMDEALKAGSNTFSLIGDNPFTVAQRYAAEAFGRMQSGGAINTDEEKRFMAMGPRPTDSPQIQADKLKKQKALFEDRLKTLGFSADEIGKNFTLSYGPQKGAGKSIPGVQDVKANGKIKVSNGSQTFEIDPSDLEDAKKDGFSVVK